MKTNRIFFTVLAFLLFVGISFSQTKKKPAPKKKAAAPVAIKVYLCDNAKDKLYHKRSMCLGLKKCTDEIKYITSSAVLKKYKRKACSRCLK